MNISQIILAVEEAKHLPSHERNEVLIRLNALNEEDEIPEDLATQIERLFQLEALKSEELVEKDTAKLKEVETEIKEIEEEQAPILQQKVIKEFEKMDQVLEDHKQAVSKIEGDFEKGMEKEVGKEDKSQADDIRKKLGLA